jgi:hypothetical protein
MKLGRCGDCKETNYLKENKCEYCFGEKVDYFGRFSGK